MRLLTTFLLMTLSVSSLAKPVQLLEMRVWKPAHSNTRIVFDLSGQAIHNIFSLSSPDRLVIDLKNTVLTKKLISPPANHALVQKIRSAPRNKDDLRIVLDLKVPVRTKSFLLKPDESNGHRLVVDINTLEPALGSLSSNKPALLPNPPALTTQNSISFPQKVTKKFSSPRAYSHRPWTNKPAELGRDVVIAVDAGHGGIDPGAIGPAGTMEKDVVLTISKELTSLIAKERGMRAVLIRNGDYFIKLRKRVNLARQYQADLFVSIHADAYPDNENVHGSSVYMLSRSGASSEAARWLARKENSADLIGGISLSDKDDLLASVLLDLSQAGSLETSAHVGRQVLTALREVGKNHLNRVQRADFIVLRSPDIPSILVETGFISNPDEEQKLNTLQHRRRLAKAIFEGIREYFANNAPPDTLLARR